MRWIAFVCLCGLSGLAAEQYPVAASKKGLQVEIIEDAIALGVKHAALNVNLAQMIDLSRDTSNPALTNGQIFYFRRGTIDRLDSQIKALTDAGALVNLIILVYQSGDPQINQMLLHPRYDSKAPNHLGAFNTVTAEGSNWLAACMEFMAQRWSTGDQSHGRVVGYIMGNEVNSHWFWCNMGRVTMQEFSTDYERTVRIAHRSVRKHSAWARVYISLEHHWNIRYPGGDDRQTFAGGPFIDDFAQRIREGGDIDWHLAFHPYPENLFEPRFWKDKSATTNIDTPRITFKNLELLPKHMQQPHLLYRGKSRRIILSEQGFHTPAGADGEVLQAAAYCYAYKKVEALEGIDAFILHRHVDNDHEGGLLLGLRRNKPNATEQRPRKKIYDCFRAADTPDWERAFQFALAIIGLEKWPNITPTAAVLDGD